MLIYSVKANDNIWSISKKYNVSMDSIISINNLTTPKNLVIGMSLIIPVTILRYTVKADDSIYTISKKYNVPAEQLISLNNLKYPYILYLGQIVTIFDIKQSKTSIQSLGYYSPSTLKNNTAVINTLGKNLTYLGVYYFTVSPSGEILGNMDLNLLQNTESKNITVIPLLANLDETGFSSELARTVLSDTATLNRLINNIINFCTKYNLKGFNIDFENLYPADRNIFTHFIKLLSQSLHKINKILIVNLAPKWEDAPEKEWVGFFDYMALGPYIDIAAIMTYEWGYIGGLPRPTAPLINVRKSLNYAIANNIPKSKILMGMTLYGYNWTIPISAQKLTTAVNINQVWDLGIKYNSVIHFDTIAKQPYMNYTDSALQKHEIWFEDARSHYFKYQLAKDYGLRGVFFWALNIPFPQTWYILNDFFSITKLA